MIRIRLDTIYDKMIYLGQYLEHALHQIVREEIILAPFKFQITEIKSIRKLLFTSIVFMIKIITNFS